MRLLFFIEPLIERQRADWKAGWANAWVAQMVRSLDAAGVAFDYRIMVSDALAAYLTVDCSKIIVVFHNELCAVFRDQSLIDVQIGWLRNTHSEATTKCVADLLQTASEGFEPDIVVTWSAAPYLSSAFPAARILHHELSLFSRPPLPETWFFDPISPCIFSYPLQHESEVESIYLNDRDAPSLSDGLRITIRERLETLSPFKTLMSDFRGRFNRVLLLALPAFSHPFAEGLSNYRSPLDCLLDVATRLAGTGTGLVVSEHPYETPIPAVTKSWIRKAYPDVLIADEFRDWDAPSELLAPFVDGIVHIFSKASLIALAFDVPIISVGANRLGILGYGSDALTSSLPSKDELAERYRAWLYYAATRYSIPKRQLWDGDWLGAYLLRCRARDPNSLGYFDPVVAPQMAIEGLTRDILASGIRPRGDI